MGTIRFNLNQLDRLSEILGNLGLVFFATLVLPFGLGQRIDYFVLVSGVLTTLVCIMTSLILLKGGKTS